MNKVLGILACVILSASAQAWAAANTGAPRSYYFEETARMAELRGDREAASMLRALGHGAATPPPELSSSAVSDNPDYASEYTSLRLRIRQAILSPAHAPEHQWRVDRAEADLHLVAHELEKGHRASSAFLQKLLTDASWALDHQIVPLGADVVIVPAPTAWIQADPSHVQVGRSSVVTWGTSNATVAMLNGEATDLAGSKTVFPTEPMRFDLVATGPGGKATAFATITIYHPAPTAQIEVRPSVIEKGQCATLSWNSTNATTVQINGYSESLSGSREVCPDATTTYDMTAKGPGGEAAASAVLTVIRRTEPRRYRIHFDFDESVIRPDAVDTMTAVARLLRNNPEMRMTVEGHCDWMGTDEYNIDLGMRRAESVRDYFVERFGMSPTLFDLVTKGEREPIASNAKPDGSDDPDGRQMNRRAEFVEILQ